MEKVIPPVRIQISHKDIDNCDPKRVVDIFKSFIPDLCYENRNRVQLELVGYEDEEREFHDIPEIRDYFQALHKKLPGMFYWLDTEGYTFYFMALMLYKPIEVNNYATVSPEDLQEYLLNGFYELNNFCRHYNLDQAPCIESIKQRLGISGE